MKELSKNTSLIIANLAFFLLLTSHAIETSREQEIISNNLTEYSENLQQEQEKMEIKTLGDYFKTVGINNNSVKKIEICATGAIILTEIPWSVKMLCAAVKEKSTASSYYFDLSNHDIKLFLEHLSKVPIYEELSIDMYHRDNQFTPYFSIIFNDFQYYINYRLGTSSDDKNYIFLSVNKNNILRYFRIKHYEFNKIIFDFLGKNIFLYNYNIKDF